MRNKEKEHKGFVDNELGISEWFGAIIRYLLNFGKKEFNNIYNKEQFKKNVIIGYIFKVIGIVVLFLFIFWLIGKQ